MKRKIATEPHTQLSRCDLGDAWHNQPIGWKAFHDRILAAIPERGLLLDAGAGEGKYREVLRGVDYHYLGVDSAVGNDTWDYTSVVKGDLSNLHFVQTASVDVVLLIQVLEHLEDPNLALMELSRVLKRNGRIFVSVPQS